MKNLKKIRLEQDSIHDLFNTGAVLYQLCYQANWELVILKVSNIPMKSTSESNK